MQPLPAGRKLVCSHQIWTERPGTVEVLSDSPLRRLRLIVTNGRVVEDRIANHVVERNILRNMPSALTDNRDHLPFIVELRRDRRTDDWCASADQAGSETRKDGGIGWHNKATLDRMIHIVKTHADDLSGS